MPKLGKYCKAYPVERLREFNGLCNLSQDKNGDPNSEGVDADFLYIQEDYVVTASIFIDEKVVFDNVTPEWIEFCKNRLNFEVPSYS
jgi:hypothetical protein